MVNEPQTNSANQECLPTDGRGLTQSSYGAGEISHLYMHIYLPLTKQVQDRHIHWPSTFPPTGTSTK